MLKLEVLKGALRGHPFASQADVVRIGRAEGNDLVLPDEHVSSDHARIARWRHAQALHRTLRDRPDLIEARGGLDETERRLLEEFPAVTYP